MLLDQQVPLEKAFSGPAGPGAAGSAMSRPRRNWPTSTPTRWPPCSASGPPCTVTRGPWRPGPRTWPGSSWTATTGTRPGSGPARRPAQELVRRIAELPGFGATKAQIFAALLGKQLGVRPPGWQEATGPFGQEGSRVSVADITDSDSLAEVRAYKQQRKAAAKGPSR